jgi:hypothetical protein
MLDENEERVGKELKHLSEHALVERQVRDGIAYHLLSQVGLRYVVAEAGYGRAFKRYARQRGGRDAIKRLLFHFEHTLATNRFLLQWVQLARAYDASFDWQSEVASRAFFWEGRELHRFLADGRGRWSKDGKPFQFVMDRKSTIMGDDVSRRGARRRGWTDLALSSQLGACPTPTMFCRGGDVKRVTWLNQSLRL